MSTAVIALSERGYYLAARICNIIDETVLFLPASFDLSEDFEVEEGIENISELRFAKKGGSYRSDKKLSEVMVAAFNNYDAIVAVMALGIVARLTAPLLKDKYHDPAIVVVDEGGRYAVSALSGHEGGANALSISVASAIGAEPVITTASETRKTLAVGVGCRRGTAAAAIEKTIRGSLDSIDRDMKDVKWMATIDIKRSESGLSEAAANLDMPIRYFSKRQISWLGGGYTGSDAARRHLGVEGVCEPCALLAAPGGKLLLSKSAADGVTVAIAEVNSADESGAVY